jgi:hypothetical protein
LALEKLNSTQIVTWQPPLPQRAFPITAAGSTTDNMGFGGASTDGKRYGYFVLNTTQWAVEEGLHTPPVQAGEQFQIYSSGSAPALGGFVNPPAFDMGTSIWSAANANASGGAPDLFVIQALIGAGRPSSSYASDVVAAASAMATAVTDSATAHSAYLTGPNVNLGVLAAAASAAQAGIGTAASKAATANQSAYATTAVGAWNAATTAFSTASGQMALAAIQATAAGSSTAATDYANASLACTYAAVAALACADAANTKTNRDGVSAADAPLWTVLNPTACTIASVQQSSSGAWYVYFTPNIAPLDTVTPGLDGIITIPRPFNPRYLGQIGHVSGISYTYSIPGGPDQLTCQLEVEPWYRTDALNPGRIVTAHRGCSCIWEGQLTEPQPAATGWTLTCNGVGTYGTNFGAWYDVNLAKGAGWTPDAPVDFAISRGLRWVNRGIGNPAGIYTGPTQDPGSLTVTDFLNLLCTGGSLIWELTQPAGAASWPPSPWELTVHEMPTDVSGNPLTAGPQTKVQTEQLSGGKWKRVDLTVTGARRPPDLFLVNTSPVARSIVADINTIIVYYESRADTTATSTKPAQAAVYETTFADAPGSVAAHGRMEYYLDVTNAGAMTRTAAQAIGRNILSKYIRANFASAFSVMPGQLLNAGGVPVDLGLNWGGAMVTVQGMNEAYGGEVGLAPMTFMIGQYAYDDDTQTAQVTPYQNAMTDMDSVVAALYPGKFSLGIIAVFLCYAGGHACSPETPGSLGRDVVRLRNRHRPCQFQTASRAQELGARRGSPLRMRCRVPGGPYRALHRKSQILWLHAEETRVRRHTWLRLASAVLHLARHAGPVLQPGR